MKVATILPQPYLELVQEDKYVLALAHLLGKPGMERYTDYFLNKGRHEEDAFVILDNGLIEGNPRPIEELVVIALTLNASELVLPDVFRDKQGTLDAIAHACAYLDTPTVSKTINKMGFMAVPQGANLEEWLDCAEILLKNPRITCLGIPKVLVSIVGRDGRYLALKELVARVGTIEKDIHLLGCWTTPLEVLTLAKGVSSGDLPAIRGVDSGISYVYARVGMRLNEDDRPDDRPINFEEGSEINPKILAWNVDYWKSITSI